MVRRRLTSIGKLVLGLMVLFYIASVTSQSGLLLLLIGLMGGCFVVNWSFSTRNALHLRVRPPQQEYLVEGGSPTQPWRFENPTSKHAEVMEVFHGDKPLFRIPVIETGAAVSAVPQLVYQRRGVYPHSLVTVSCSAPYGLIQASRQLSLPGEVVVFPRVYEVQSPAAAGVEMIFGGRSRGGRRVNTGAHFAGVRAWQDGDSLRQIHWKTTARRGELMVKTFEEELGGRVSLVLDISSGASSVIDDAVRATASLGAAALQDAHHLEFFDGSGQPPFRWAAFSDEGEFLDLLARHQGSRNSRLPGPEQIWRRSTVVLIGTAWREEWRAMIDEFRALNRTVQIYLPDRSEVPSNLAVEVFYFSDREIWPRMEGSLQS